MEDKPEEFATFTIIKGGSSKKKDILVSSDGYSFRLQNENPVKGNTWLCTGRNIFRKNGKIEYFEKCSVKVYQKEELFFSDNIHNHAPKDRMLEHLLLRQQIRKAALKKFHKSVNFIRKDAGINDKMKKDIDEGVISRYKNFNMCYESINYFRKSGRPKNPTELGFEIDMNFIENFTSETFLRCDLIGEDDRHFIFAADNQLELLSKTKVWYITKTKRYMNPVFCQLLSVHGFGRSDDCVQQVPLLYVIMSHNREEDYIKVFSTLLKILPSRPEVDELVVFMDLKLLSGLHSLFDVPIRVSVFSYWEVLYDKMKEMDLLKYLCLGNEDQIFTMQLFGLLLVPGDAIALVFQKLLQESLALPHLKPIFSYIRMYCLENNAWYSSWSVYGRPLSEENEMKIWHNRLVYDLRVGRRQFYTIIPLFYNESKCIPPTFEMLSKSEVERHVKENVINFQYQLEEVWSCYQCDEIDLKTLLKETSYIYWKTSLKKRVAKLRN